MEDRIVIDNVSYTKEGLEDLKIIHARIAEEFIREMLKDYDDITLDGEDEIV